MVTQISRTWTIEANAAPTIVIDSPADGSEIAPGETVTLMATVEPPEPNQDVAVNVDFGERHLH